MRTLFLTAVALLGLAACYATPPKNPLATSPHQYGGAILEGAEMAIIENTNIERARAGLPAFENDAALTELARDRARGNLDELSKLLNDMGYEYRLAAEHHGVAKLAGRSYLSDELMAQWRDSAHLKNAGFKRMGVGVYKDQHGEIHGVQVFAEP